MSILSKLLGGAKKVVQAVAPALSVIPGPVGMIAAGVGAAAGAPKTTSPSRAPAPAAGFLGGGTLPSVGGVTPLGGMFGEGLMSGLGAAAPGGSQAMKYGKLSGNMIPAGYREVMDKNGYIRVVKMRRSRGISGADLRRARRVIGAIERFSAYLKPSPARRFKRA